MTIIISSDEEDIQIISVKNPNPSTNLPIKINDPQPIRTTYPHYDQIDPNRTIKNCPHCHQKFYQDELKFHTNDCKDSINVNYIIRGKYKVVKNKDGSERVIGFVGEIRNSKDALPSEKRRVIVPKI